jgi:tetratricopeptide (TPR) repeat protein
LSAAQTFDLAVKHHQAGNRVEAERLYQRTLQAESSHVGALQMLGLLAFQAGRSDLAVAYLREVLRLHPQFPEAHINLGNVLNAQGKLKEAIASYREALRLKPDDAGAHYNLGNTLKNQGELDEAIGSFQQALRLKPDFADAHNNLGLIFTELGRMDEAIASVQETIRLNPKHVVALWQLAKLLGGKLPEADRVVLEKRLADPDVKDADRISVLFILAQVSDAKGEYELAAAQVRRAKALALRRHQGKDYDPAENRRFIDNLMTVFTPDFFERVRGFGLETERPVFIVGLPRSGTTLTEQILAAHSQVFGIGEASLVREDLFALGMQPGEQNSFAAVPSLQRDRVRRVAERHLEQLRTLNGTAARVVDKMPDSYLYLGLLAVLFPRAKFVHCRRDLRDVAVSCWMTNFVDLRWTNDPRHIVDCFVEYHRLMEYWRAVLPVSMLEVNYEETVTDLPGTARHLVEWCGLRWEPACLTFHESKKPVRTASMVQVRQPIYTRSVGRWRNYERDLGALFEALTPLLDKGSAAARTGN